MAEAARELEVMEPVNDGVLPPVPHNREGMLPEIAYPEETKQEVFRKVLEEGRSITLVAREMGISRDTISVWLRELEEQTRQDAKVLDVHLVRILGSKMKELIRALTSEKLAKASPRDIAIAFGILADKRRDLLGPQGAGSDGISLKIAWKDGGGAVELSTKTTK